jgi:tetratricopeptide (TPR) repeat protein
VTAHAQLGWVFYVQKQYEQSLPHFERAIELERDRSRLAQYLHATGWVHLHAQRFQQSRAAFDKALELTPDLVGAREGLKALGNRGR